MSRSDEEQGLIQRMMRGDREALSELLMLYYDRLARHVARQIPDEMRSAIDAEDVVQTSYRQAFRALGGFEPRAEFAFWGWLKTIADNCLRDAQRVQRRQPRPAAPAADALDPFDRGLRDLCGQLPDDQRLPWDQARLAELRRLLALALECLSEEQRQVVWLQFFEQRSLGEIADQVGRSVPAVRGLRHRAMQQLRAHLGRLSLYSSG